MIFPGGKEYYQEVIAPFKIGTCYTLRSIAILAEHGFLDYLQCRDEFSRTVKLRLDFSDEQKDAVELLLLKSLQELSFLNAYKNHNLSKPYMRQAIVSFYYSIYSSAAAAVFCQSGSCGENHSEVANAWAKEIAKFFPGFLSLIIKGISPKNVKAFGDLHGRRPQFVKDAPSDFEEAKRIYSSALIGTADKRMQYLAPMILKKHNLQNFLTRKAQNIRDEALNNHVVGFIDWCFRFRKSAHYGEMTYLCFGMQQNDEVTELSNKALEDMIFIADTFFKCTYAFCSARVGNSLLEELSKKRESIRFPIDDKIYGILPAA